MNELDGFMKRIRKVDEFIELFFPMGSYHNLCDATIRGVQLIVYSKPRFQPLTSALPE